MVERRMTRAERRRAERFARKQEVRNKARSSESPVPSDLIDPLTLPVIKLGEPAYRLIECYVELDLRARWSNKKMAQSISDCYKEEGRRCKELLVISPWGESVINPHRRADELATILTDEQLITWCVALAVKSRALRADGAVLYLDDGRVHGAVIAPSMRPYAAFCAAYPHSATWDQLLDAAKGRVAAPDAFGVVCGPELSASLGRESVSYRELLPGEEPTWDWVRARALTLAAQAGFDGCYIYRGKLVIHSRYYDPYGVPPANDTSQAVPKNS